MRLLCDIRDVFEAANVGSPCRRRCWRNKQRQIEESPWGEWGKRGKPLDARALARLLTRYTIKPRSVRLASGETPKGYHRDRFADVWARYTPGF